MKKQKTNKFVVALKIAALVATLAGVVFTFKMFASQWVWLTLLISELGILYFLYEKNIRVLYLLSQMKWPAIVGGTIGIISTLVQFASEIYEFFSFEVMPFLSLGTFLIFLIVISMTCYYGFIGIKEGIINRKKQKAERKKEILEKKKKERLQERISFLQSIEKTDWKEILILALECEKHSLVLPHCIFANAALFDLLDVSKLKKQACWRGGDFNKALYHLEQTVKRNFDDKVLEKIIRQITILDLLKEYKGYNDIYDSVMSYKICDVLNITLPPKKEKEEIFA